MEVKVACPSAKIYLFCFNNNAYLFQGLVTPCDHGSIYGGIKPLRQQQQQTLLDESDENRPRDEFYGSGDMSENNNHKVIIYIILTKS